MSSSSDSDDDIPLSQLKTSLTPAKKHKSTPANKRKASAKKRKTPAKKKKVVSESEEESSEEESSEEDETSSEDEMSLADLKKNLAKKKKAATKKKTAAAKKKAAASKKRSRSKSKRKSKKKSKSSGTSKAKSVATGILGTTDINTYKESDGARKPVTTGGMTKQQLVTAVLCRWWYAFDWPTNENLERARQEMLDTKSYRELSGMPGVFICILGEDTGKLIDKRDLNSGIVPSVASLMKRSSDELIDLWGKALKGQIKALEENEAEDNPKLLKALNKELNTVQKLNREKIKTACARQNKTKK